MTCSRITGELLKNTEAEAYFSRWALGLCIFTKFPGNSDIHQSVRTAEESICLFSGEGESIRPGDAHCPLPPAPPRKALIPGRLGEMLRCFLSTAWGVSAKP